MKCTCKANDSTYYFIRILDQNKIDLETVGLLCKQFVKNVISLLVKEIILFEMLPPYNVLRYLPQRDQNTHGGI